MVLAAHAGKNEAFRAKLWIGGWRYAYPPYACWKPPPWISAYTLEVAKNQIFYCPA
jgi:hypothetical protein